MPTRKVPHRRRLAMDDIAGHSHHIAEKNLGAAMRFLDSIFTSETIDIVRVVRGWQELDQIALQSR
jgi:hypothetical protein